MTNEYNKSMPYGTYSLKGYDRSLFETAQKLKKNWFNFKLALALRNLVTYRKNYIIDADVMGMKCRFYPHDNLADRFILFMPKFYDPCEFYMLSKILSSESVFIDIGANVGFYSLWASKFITNSGKIIAIEPNPKIFERLIDNISFNQKEDTITALQVGVADRVGEFTLRIINKKNLGASTILESNDEPESIAILCRPLISILRDEKVNAIDVLKIDIEGAEHIVLNTFFQNAPQSLFPKILIIETDENVPLADFGYKLVKRTEANNSIWELR
jgi:FkbM family methyltransferase